MTGHGAVRLFPRSIRWRLTLLYSALFVVAGAVLLGVVYFLAASSVAGGHSLTSVEGPGRPDEGATPTSPATIRAVAEVIRRDQLHELLVYAAVALAVMALASVALGWLMAGRVLAPVRVMTGTARRISADNLHERLAVSGPHDELKAMADTFDDVLARLEGAFEAQKQFVANASHELRTPLTLQQTIVDVTLADPTASRQDLRAALLRVRAAGQEQERLIDALLTLARSQRGLERRELVDLAAIVRERLPGGRGRGGGCRDAGERGVGGSGIGEREGAERGVGGSGTGERDHEELDIGEQAVGWRVEARLEPAVVFGDPQLVERLVVNLSENAVRRNLPAGEGGWVSVWTGVDAAGRPGLRIENSGPVIAADQAAGLFQPFRRLGPDRVRKRDGLGLGLSIVAAVVAAHGGRVRALTRPTGGLAVEVSLPAAGVSLPPVGVSLPATGVSLPPVGVSLPAPDISQPPPGISQPPLSPPPRL
ncbi:sensor histidine kinase [Streptomyces sp. NPDC001617]